MIVFNVGGNNKYRLYSMLNSPERSNASIVFDIVSETKVDGEFKCSFVASAEVNLHQLVDYGKDLHEMALAVKDTEHEVEVGTLHVSILAMEALKTVLNQLVM